MDHETAVMPALDLLDVQVWNVYWGDVARRIDPVFTRLEARTRATAYLAGLLSPVERKNSWQLAEITGDVNPYGFQHLLGRAEWDPDVLRDRLYAYVIDYLHAPETIGVIDETGFLKKGLHSAGVARQYSGTAGRIENCQMGVFLAYASAHGHTLLDRELYLPEAWTADRDRCQRAGIPDGRSFATKPALARQMLERARTAGVDLTWVTGDSIYGMDRTVRQWLEDRHQAYVLAVTGQASVWVDHQQHSVLHMLTTLPDAGWARLSAGRGSKGPRWYDWSYRELSAPPQAGWTRGLLVRRSLSDPSKVTASITFAPTDHHLTDLVRVAGMRWTVEESFQTGKGEVGLDHYEVRSWTGWYRHITLALWAQAFLAVVRAERGAELVPKKGRVNPPGARSLALFKARRGLRSG